MRVSRDIVIQVASDIADKDGLNKLSLKVVAEKLSIRTPSLYNHIESLDDLLREVAHNGMRKMNKQMEKVAIGDSGDTAIKSVSIAYFNFIIAHPGVYETIQWAIWHGNKETSEIFEEYKSLLEKLILSCNLRTKNIDEVLNLLMSVIHGYSTLQLGKALLDSEEAIKSLSDTVDTVLLGIHKKYD
ncbi:MULTISPECIES: TetR/AcrR family transcriptional regulator [unclassified Clostridioides]|uniref:TetR/AcrR family transcriptional regulator n=1 Tax=unclassified Clostridioides TaxID=2635829 RepID=UPI001D0C02C7|nr:TetR/AcrR family transcriptional regulator [Clostridioides sp. ES-S-0001-02]MCC0638694.1 TetR/AcrR family transcriptional regulator [Clostridioides sp. ES-S-0049-03]MCC0655142.1 TetR/AcrR family transcriptional regulator [Clostridioides sp. ES-S-0123-01]MCC0673058.1 TetR/AcrR family transcriptional regulator [Clostridioides sp. ES-S-0145-01]MCC0675082.1 TetR/AcrR family transcriptional regulator [Clostridioides sp. ES-W-0018-02]MCC0679692.1 TetR/AcrR family transcriptional regulator [Clostr